MNLRELCQIPNLPFAVLTTYNIDPLFFERVILTDLIQGGATRIVLLADAGQALDSLSRVRGQLLALGRRYRLIPIHGKGSFHPKLCVRVGAAGAVVACGSHNLTRSGWLGCRKSDNGGGNREVTVAWQIEPGTYAAGELAIAVRALAQLAETPSDRDEILNTIPAGWPSAFTGEDRNDWTWTVTGADSTLATTLLARWPRRRFDRIRVACGSTDERGAMLRWAAEAFGVREAIVEVDLSCCGFDPRQLTDLPLRLRIVPYDGQPRTHLKTVLFESANDCAAVIGSANCSSAAWLRRSTEAGNIESVVIFDRCNAADFTPLFRAAVGDAMPWDQVGLSVPARLDDAGNEAVDHRLRQIQLHRAAGELIVVLDADVPDGMRLHAVVQQSRVPLRRTAVWNQYRGPMPDLVEGPETLFGYVEWESADGVERTNDIWVDDIDKLSEAAGRHHRFDSVRKLSSLGISADYKRLLEDLQVLSQTLLSSSEAFPDGAARREKEEKAEATTNAEPVTAGDVIQTLDQLSSPHGPSATGSAYGGALSLAGIMRLLFTEGADASDVDPTAAEHQRSNEEKESEQGEQQNQSEGGSDTVDDAPSDSQRRLLDQLRQFLDRLGEPAFASKCSARQLQQAAAFPLAIARFASRGPWVQEAELSVLSQTVQRTCELLFFRDHVENNPKTGVSRRLRPLLQEVRERYAKEGRVEAFDQIIGDGTLWLVLIGSLTLFAGPTDKSFSRNLILRDIARYPSLSVGIVPSQLAALARRINVESGVEPLALAKRAVERFDTMESFLRERFEDLKQRTASSRAAVGDWLWNTGVGFAEVVELQESQKAKVHVRKRAETLNNVRLSFYVNLRVLADQDADFRNLYEACWVV